MSPQTCHCGILTSLCCSPWKTANAGRRCLWTPFKHGSERNAVFINFLLRSWINQGRLILITEETISSHHTNKPSLKLSSLSLFLLRIHWYFLKVICFPQIVIQPPYLFLLRWAFSLNFKQPLRVWFFPLGYFLCIHKVFILINLCFLLLICFLFQRS